MASAADAIFFFIVLSLNGAHCTIRRPAPQELVVKCECRNNFLVNEWGVSRRAINELRISHNGAQMHSNLSSMSLTMQYRM